MGKLSDDLLEQAGFLAGRETKKPKQASVRRSVSTSYYALFHFLIEEATSLIVGTRREERAFAGRAFDHGKMKLVCEELVRPTPKSRFLKKFLKKANPTSQRLASSVAQTFIDLQEDRHSADYDMSEGFSRGEGYIAHQRSAAAMADWKSLKGDEDFSRVFALMLCFWQSLSRT